MSMNAGRHVHLSLYACCCYRRENRASVFDIGSGGVGVLQWGMDWDAEVHWNLHNCTIACHAVDALVVKDGRSWLLDIRWLWAHKWGGVGGH